jgi:serine protease Do
VSVRGSASISFTASENGNWEVYDNGKAPIKTSGTAFFISDNGMLITNKHIVEPWSYNEEVTSLTYALTNFFPADIRAAEVGQFLRDNWSKRYDYDEEGGESMNAHLTHASAHSRLREPELDEMSNRASMAVSLKETLNAVDDEHEALNYLPNKAISIQGRRIQVYIVLQGSNLSTTNSIPCKVFEKAHDNTIDLALIQTKDHKLPIQVQEYVHLEEAFLDDQEIKRGSTAYLLGYPMGITIGPKGKDIHLQVYEGKVIKESDGVSIQYHITTNHGTSGSPVINDCGQLIAINYAGFDVAQGSNYGIAARHAVALVKEK